MPVLMSLLGKYTMYFSPIHPQTVTVFLFPPFALVPFLTEIAYNT